jgi:hypothetical protein
LLIENETTFVKLKGDQLLWKDATNSSTMEVDFLFLKKIMNNFQKVSLFDASTLEEEVTPQGHHFTITILSPLRVVNILIPFIEKYPLGYTWKNSIITAFVYGRVENMKSNPSHQVSQQKACHALAYYKILGKHYENYRSEVF